MSTIATLISPILAYKYEITVLFAPIGAKPLDSGKNGYIMEPIKAVFRAAFFVACSTMLDRETIIKLDTDNGRPATGVARLHSRGQHEFSDVGLRANRVQFFRVIISD